MNHHFRGSLQPRPDQTQFQRYRLTNGLNDATPDPTVTDGPGFVYGDPTFCLMQNISAVNATLRGGQVSLKNVTFTQIYNGGGLDVNFSIPGGSLSMLSVNRYPLLIASSDLGDLYTFRHATTLVAIPLCTA